MLQGCSRILSCSQGLEVSYPYHYNSYLDRMGFLCHFCNIYQWDRDMYQEWDSESHQLCLNSHQRCNLHLYCLFEKLLRCGRIDQRGKAGKQHLYSGLSGCSNSLLGKGFAMVSRSQLGSRLQLDRLLFKKLLPGSSSLQDMAYKNSILPGLGKYLQGMKFKLKHLQDSRILHCKYQLWVRLNRQGSNSLLCSCLQGLLVLIESRSNQLGIVYIDFDLLLLHYPDSS